MSNEKAGYRENLQGLMEFAKGRSLLSLADVRAYTGLADNRTVKRLFPGFVGGYISIYTLARFLAGGKT